MKILLHTYRDIKWIVPIYTLLHKKYWGNPLLLVAEEDYSEGAFDFLRPPQVGKDGVIHGGEYARVLGWSLDQFEDPLVLIMLADYLITDPVDKCLMKTLEDYMLEDDSIMRCQVGGRETLGTLKTDSYKGVNMYENGFLPSSLTPGIWNKAKLKEILNREINTAWDLERIGRDVFYEKGRTEIGQSGWRSIGLDYFPMHYENALRGRNNYAMVTTPGLLVDIEHLIPSGVSHD